MFLCIGKIHFSDLLLREIIIIKEKQKEASFPKDIKLSHKNRKV